MTKFSVLDENGKWKEEGGCCQHQTELIRHSVGWYYCPNCSALICEADWLKYHKINRS